MSSILKNITLIKTPEISEKPELVLVEYSKDSQNISFDGLIENDTKESPDKILNIKLKISAYDYEKSTNTKLDYFSNDTGIRKYLRFKAISCFSQEEESFYTQSLYAMHKDKNSVKTRIFSAEDFKETLTIDPVKGKKYTLEIENKIYQSKVSNIRYFSIIFFPYYEIEEFLKEFRINLSSLEDAEILFSGTPVVYKIIDNRVPFFADLFVDNTALEKINIDLMNDSQVKFAKLISNGIVSLPFALPAATSTLKFNPELISTLQTQIAVPSIQQPKNSLKTESINKFLNKFDKQSYFSNLFTSQDLIAEDGKTKNILRYGFFFDYKNYILENSAFSTMINVSSNDIKNEFFSQSRIIDIKIYRIKESLYRHKLTENKNVGFSNFIDRSGDYSTKLLSQAFYGENEQVTEEIKVKRNNFEYLNGLEFFSGIDKSCNDLTAGTYKYKVILKIIDGSYFVVVKLKERLLENLTYLKQYYNLSKLPEIYFKEMRSHDPHINSQAEFSSLNIKSGNYIISENRFNENLNSKLQDLINITDDYEKVYLIIANSDPNITIEKVQANVAAAKEAKASMLNSIKPGFGNPDGVLNTIKLHETLIEKINYLLQSKASSYTVKNEDGSLARSFVKTLELEEIFDNFIFNADLPKNFGLNYFSAPPLSNFGLGEFNRGYIEDLTFNKKLIYLYLPDNKNYFRINITDKDGKLNNESGDKLYNSIENILSSYSENNIKNLLSRTQAIKSLTANKVEEANSIFNNLFSNNINLDFSKASSVPLRTTNKLEALQKSREITLNLFQNRNFSKISNLLNNSKTETLKNKEAFFENVNNLAKTLPINTLDYANTNLEKTSKFKIREKTIKKIYIIDFKKQYGKFLLKDPIYIPLNEATDNGKFLCLLSDQNTSDAEVNQNLFPFSPEIPIFNEYFIFDNSDVQLNTQIANLNNFNFNVNLPRNILNDANTKKILADVGDKLAKDLGVKLDSININNNSLGVPGIKDNIAPVNTSFLNQGLITQRTIFDSPVSNNISLQSTVQLQTPSQINNLGQISNTGDNLVAQNQQKMQNKEEKLKQISSRVNKFINRSKNK